MKFIIKRETEFRDLKDYQAIPVGRKMKEHFQKRKPRVWSSDPLVRKSVMNKKPGFFIKTTGE